jgi:hypothetical protein
MKKKTKFILVLGFMIIAFVTSGVPFGRQGQGASRIGAAGCYTEQEVELLMQENHFQRDQAIELLELSCEYAVKAK